MPPIIGVDHIYLAVSDLARSRAFYDVVLREVLGFEPGEPFSLGGEAHVHYYNHLFGIVLRAARQPAPHDPYAPGLHHLCLRVERAEDVERVAAELTARGVAASPARLYPEYAPDYSATFFSDPDGIRLEVTQRIARICGVAAEPFETRFFAYFQRRAVAMPGAARLLADLRREGHYLAALSDVPYAMPTRLLRQDLGDLAAVLDRVASSCEVGERKPSGKGLRDLLAQSGCAPHGACYVGNEAKDVAAARHARQRQAVLPPPPGAALLRVPARPG